MRKQDPDQIIVIGKAEFAAFLIAIAVLAIAVLLVMVVALASLVGGGGLDAPFNLMSKGNVSAFGWRFESYGSGRSADSPFVLGHDRLAESIDLVNDWLDENGKRCGLERIRIYPGNLLPGQGLFEGVIYLPEEGGIPDIVLPQLQIQCLLK